MDQKKFSRTIENFTCEHCGHLIKGNGYTNHCPHCFYSKHVDINPGDRAALCKGLMRPLSYETHSKKGIILTHECVKCKVIKRNKLAATDDISQLVACFKK